MPFSENRNSIISYYNCQNHFVRFIIRHQLSKIVEPEYILFYKDNSTN